MRPLKYPHAVLTKVASCLQFRPINRPHVKTRWLAYGRDVTRLRHYSEFMNGEMPGTCEEERQCRQVPVDGRLERRTVGQNFCCGCVDPSSQVRGGCAILEVTIF